MDIANNISSIKFHVADSAYKIYSTVINITEDHKPHNDIIPYHIQCYVQSLHSVNI